MPTTKTWVQDVVPGYAEYLTQAFTMTALNDYVEFEFNRPTTAEEIIVETTGSSLDAYNLSIIFPSKEKELVIKSAQSGDTNYYLNRSGSPGRKWYRIPSRGKLRVTCSTFTSSFNITLFAVGKSSE